MMFAMPLMACDGLYSVKEIGEVDDERMWTVPDLTRGILYQSIDDMPKRPDRFGDNFLDVATDNAVTNSINTGIHNVALGRITSNRCSISIWDQCLAQIQMMNLFLEKALTPRTRYEFDPISDSEEKAILKGQAKYIRAWWSAYLLQYHGGRAADGQALGYPIALKYISDPEEAAALPRNTFEECVAQICADCDSAAKVLPAKASATNAGQPNALMAEFLKARVLFLAACPAYQSESIVRIDGIGQYTVVDAAAYKAKWEAAARQAWKVIGLSGVSTYPVLKNANLVDIDANTTSIPADFVDKVYHKSNDMETRNYPLFYYGHALCCPSQDLVDAYPMKANGFPITDIRSGYLENDPYTGRDDRLDATIYHHGSAFSTEGTNIDISDGGKDSRTFTYGAFSGSRTGYYLKKFLSTKKGLLTPTASGTTVHFYPTMRIAEMYLCLAEASNEAWGPTGKGDGISLSAYDIIKSVRALSGGIVTDQYIEELKTDKDAFTALILNERRLEFAFENFRFWDIRRRLLPFETTVSGATYDRDNASYGKEVVENREWDNIRYYYLPVPYAQTSIAPSVLINNIGY